MCRYWVCLSKLGWGYRFWVGFNGIKVTYIGMGYVLDISWWNAEIQWVWLGTVWVWDTYALRTFRYGYGRTYTY